MDFVVRRRPRLAEITEPPKMDFADYERRLTSLQGALQLIQQGYLDRTPRGRCATALAYRRFGLTPPAGQANIFDG